MDGEGCWSTVVSSAAERRALGLPDSAGWMLQCKLGVGHRGNHATDGSAQPRADRRYWLEWNDFDPHAQSLIERNPCPIASASNTACLYFHGHPGPHAYVRSNGHAPTALAGATSRATTWPTRPESAQPTGPGQVSGPSTGDLPVASIAPEQAELSVRAGSHRLPDTYVEMAAPAADDSYRGGRRSSDAAPPADQQPYAGHRHASEPTFPVDTAAGVGARVDGDPASVSDALDQVAAALSALAAALRR